VRQFTLGYPVARESSFSPATTTQIPLFLVDYRRSLVINWEVKGHIIFESSSSLVVKDTIGRRKTARENKSEGTKCHH
jgi:hypothetical protein